MDDESQTVLILNDIPEENQIKITVEDNFGNAFILFTRPEQMPLIFTNTIQDSIKIGLQMD